MKNKLLNFVIFQIGWLACVLGTARGHDRLGPWCVAGITACYLARGERRGRELQMLLIVAALGTTLDSLAVVSGFLSFRGTAAADWLCPYWITALWLVFGTTLDSSLRWLQGRPLLAMLFGAAGGPLAYWAGQRLGALDFGPSPTAGLCFVAVEWAIALPVLSGVARTLVSTSDPDVGAPDAVLEGVP